MKISESNNYKRFVVSPFNREIRKTNALEKSFLQYGWLSAYPLHVKRLPGPGGQLEIISGHHRFYVAQKLGIMVKYVEDNTIISEQLLHDIENATNPWTLKDWLISHVRRGDTEYATLYDYHKRTGIGIGNCIALLSAMEGGGKINTKFKEGKLQIAADRTVAEIVGKVVMLCKSLGIPFSKDKLFVGAVAKVSMADGFDLEIMLSKITTHHAIMQKKATQKEYIQLLDAVFSRQSHVKIPLAFNTEEAMRKRD